MKFNPSWSQVVLLVALFAAPICAHSLAPGAAGTVDSMATMVIGGLLLAMKKESP